MKTTRRNTEGINTTTAFREWKGIFKKQKETKKKKRKRA